MFDKDRLTACGSEHGTLHTNAKFDHHLPEDGMLGIVLAYSPVVKKMDALEKLIEEGLVG